MLRRVKAEAASAKLPLSWQATGASVPSFVPAAAPIPIDLSYKARVRFRPICDTSGFDRNLAALDSRNGDVPLLPSEQMEPLRVKAPMRIELNCRECGSNRFTLDRDTDDDAHVECEDCGHRIGTMADLKHQIAQEVLKRARVAQPTITHLPPTAF